MRAKPICSPARSGFARRRCAMRFLVLAQTDEGLSCFLVPRVLSNGTRNVFRIQRLKDKLGNRSNASAEIEFDGTAGILIGEPGRGVQTIIAMVNQTRLDCVIGSAAGMREAVVQAIHHAAHRSAFGETPHRPAAHAQRAGGLGPRVGSGDRADGAARVCVDRAERDEHEARVQRIGTAVAKYWICKRAAGHAAEAMECLGGNGYIEEFIMPRLYREAPVNSIWEGSGNVNALDVLRALSKSRSTAETFFAEVEQAAGADRPTRCGGSRAARRPVLLRTAQNGVHGPSCERMAVVWQASLLVRMRRTPSPMHFARRGWAATGAARTAPYRPRVDANANSRTSVRDALAVECDAPGACRSGKAVVVRSRDARPVDGPPESP